MTMSNDHLNLEGTTELGHTPTGAANLRESSGVPTHSRSLTTFEAITNNERSPALRVLTTGMVCALFVCMVVLGKTIFTTTKSASASQNATADRYSPSAGPSAPASVATHDAGLDAAGRLQREGRFGEAGAILEKLIEKNATDQTARVAYAQSLIGQKKYKAAYEQYEAAIALMGSSPRITKASTLEASKSLRDPAGAQLHFEAGTCANLAELPSRAQEHYEMAQTLDPSESRYPLYLAMMQIKRGDDPAANASLLRAVKLKPDLAEGWGTMAELALKQNRLGLASQHVGEARKLQPEVARWRVLEARVLNRQNKPEQAATLLLALDPSVRREKGVMGVLSESYGLLNKPSDAASMYVEAASANLSDPELSYNAAVWLERSGESTKAVNFAKTASMLGHQAAHDLLAKLGGQSASPRD